MLLVLQNGEITADRYESAAGGTGCAFVGIGQSDFHVLAGFEAFLYLGGGLGCVPIVEIDGFTRSGAHHIDDLAGGRGLEGQRAEGGRGDGLGGTPAVTQSHFALAHEEAESVFEDGHGLGSRLPDLRVIDRIGRLRC